MIYREYAPCRPLAHFIERFWHCSDTPAHRRERILPSGTFELVINLREDEIRIYDPLHPDRCRRFSGGVVSGPYSGCFIIDPRQHASIIGVHFKPGGAFPFLGVPANEFADAHVDLEDVWGAVATELRERLCAAATAERRFSVLQAILLSRLGQLSDHHGAVPVALERFDKTNGAIRVADVARRLGLSQRRFIQVFSTEVGLTPKLFCRVLRFQHARELVQNMDSPEWARVAVNCGYFDQSHLIREFQALSGLSPADYLCRRSERVLTNHVL